MAVFKCKMCGGNLEVQDGMTVCECEYCGSTQTVPSLDNEKKITLFTRANRLRSTCEFDKAFGVYESIVTEFQEEAEAYWGLILCKYGIEYVDDPKTGKKIPTCHRSSFDNVMDDANFEMVMEYSDPTSRAIYREEAKVIESLRVGIIEVSSKEDPYDIFICYKETDALGERTIDSVIAQDVYDALTEKGYRVFFSRITLEDKLGQEYEPYIFAALNSAKIMLAFGTDYEYYNAVWVKNEWSRFLSLIEKGEKKTLIPCYKGIDAYDMPKEFARLQAQDMGKIGAIQDLLRGIEKILGKKEVISTSTSTSSNPLVKRGYIYLEDKDYAKATEYFDKALDENPENGEAYLGKVFAKLHIQNLDELQVLPISLDSIPDFQKAVRFADSNLKNSLTNILEANKSQIGNNNDLIKNIQSGTTANLIRLAPTLQQALVGVPDSALKETFGVEKSVIEKILAEYEVYSIFENSSDAMNTSALREQSDRIAKLSEDELRSIMVELNHAGYLMFKDRKFSFLSETFRKAKNDEYRSGIQKNIDELEAKVASVKQRELSLPTQIADERKKLADSEQLYAETAKQDELKRQSILAEIEADTRQRDGLVGQIRMLENEQSALGFFQGKRKKEISEQIFYLNNNVNYFNAAIQSKSAQLANIGGADNVIKEIERNIIVLESELQGIPAELSKLNNRLTEMKKDRDSYEWKPEMINSDFDESEPLKHDVIDKRQMDTSSLDDYILKTFKPTNQKVQAIKYYREMTGLGLKEAKDAVDRLF